MSTIDIRAKRALRVIGQTSDIHIRFDDFDRRRLLAAVTQELAEAILEEREAGARLAEKLGWPSVAKRLRNRGPKCTAQ